MKSMIEAEVRKRELADNIKLGPGGIRELEFFAQSMQLVRGGADPLLRGREFRGAMSALAGDRGLGRETVASLLRSYEFLRSLENAIQAIRDQQTHDVPEAPADRQRLCLALGYRDWRELEQQLVEHRRRVAEAFAAVAFRTASPQDSVADQRLVQLWESAAAADAWSDYFHDGGFEDPAELGKALAGFVAEPALRNIDALARRRLIRFVAALTDLLRDRRNPGPTCRRVLVIVAAVIRRSAYIALLNENPAVLDRLVGLCEKSGYIAGEIARYPLLLDELLDSRIYTAEISIASMREDLASRLDRVDAGDSEQAVEALARFQRAQLFRIAIQDVSGRLPVMKSATALQSWQSWSSLLRWRLPGTTWWPHTDGPRSPEKTACATPASALSPTASSAGSSYLTVRTWTSSSCMTRR